MKYQLKQHEMKIIFLVMGLICCLLLFANVATTTTEYAEMSSNLNPNPPNNPVRLIFIHHSTGEHWLDDENGSLGVALRDHNYFVSDTSYGWGPDNIGDRTDIGNWWEWFRGSESSTYLNALYSEGEQHCSYSRLSSAPSGENEIIMFKSCFPNSALQGNPNDSVPSIDNNPLRGQDSSSEYHTVANAKGIYIDILEYFRTRQDKLFIVITAPPLMASTTNTSQAANARAFNNWLMNDWLRDYPYNNVFVFDFYNVLTSNGGDPDTNDLGSVTGNHHRWWNGAVQHIQTVNYNMAVYPTGDSHPSQAGNLKATGEFLDLLNIAYNRWKGEAPPACATPETPSGPSPSNGATGVSTNPTLSWASSTNTNSYDVYFGTSSNPPYVGKTTGTNYARSGLSNSTIYYWKIVAKNNCGNSTPGPVWSFTTSNNATAKHRWNTTYSAKISIPGVISASDTTFGNCTLYDDGTFNCYEDEHGRDRNYNGTYISIGSTKNSIKYQFSFDSNGLQEYKNMLTDWAEDLANDEGAAISNISFNFTSVKTSQVTISKKTNLPGNVTLTIKGKVSANLNGKYTTKSFSYTSKIAFQYAP